MFEWSEELQMVRDAVRKAQRDVREALDEMGERFIEPWAIAHAVGKALRQLFEKRRVLSITAAQYHQAEITLLQ